jgi:hypothetical protein
VRLTNGTSWSKVAAYSASHRGPHQSFRAITFKGIPDRETDGVSLRLAILQRITASVVLDAYTSTFSHDVDGDLSELYFTNTGFALLAVSLASSVAMNILLSSNLLNAIVATTFGITFLASLAVGKRETVLPVLALRRAGRFIWSDTPFVNFFSLIYIIPVRHG